MVAQGLGGGCGYGRENGVRALELSLLADSLRALLREGGFLAGPERHAVKDLVAPLRRSRLSGKEARLWIAALKKVGRGR